MRGKIHYFIIFVATTTRMAIEHLPFLTLQNAGFGPGRAKSSILQGRGTILSQNHPKICGFLKSNSHPCPGSLIETTTPMPSCGTGTVMCDVDVCIPESWL